MNIDRLISDLEEAKECDLFTENQVGEIDDVLRVLRAHQVLSEGEDGGAEHKLERIVARLKKERYDTTENVTVPSKYRQGYQMGISKALSVVKGEIEDEQGG